MGAQTTRRTAIVQLAARLWRCRLPVNSPPRKIFSTAALMDQQRFTYWLQNNNSCKKYPTIAPKNSSGTKIKKAHRIKLLALIQSV